MQRAIDLVDFVLGKCVGLQQYGLHLFRPVDAWHVDNLAERVQEVDLAEELPVMQGYHVEQQYTLRLGTSPDVAEAASAFMEKRAPVWPSAL